MKTNKDQYKKIIIFTELIILFAIFTVMFGIVWYDSFVGELVLRFFRRGHWAVIGVYALMLLLFGKLFGCFRVSIARRTDMFFSFIFNILVTNVIMYFIIVALTLEYAHLSIFVLLFVAECVITVLWIIAVYAVNSYIYPPHNMLLIHADYSPKEVILEMNKRRDRYSIQEAVNINLGLDKIKEYIDKCEAVVISDVPAEQRNDVLKYCYELDKRIYMLPKITDIIIRSADEIHIFDTPVLLARNYGLSFEQKMMKRAMDIIVSGIAIIIAAIPMVIIAGLIKADDGGPVFFKQDRLTRGGKIFRIIKFRSMRTDAEKNGAQLMKADDDRVTKVGKILRRTHMDELPQLFNVFKGDMSIVGPRPERPEIMDDYIKNVPEFKYRLKVKGGLTGYAQVYGKYNTTPYNKLRLDLTYIQNYSVHLDIKVMVLTVKILFKKETSEGVADNQKTALKD